MEEATAEGFSVVRKVFWSGASLKDAGRLTFAAAKMGTEIIPGLLASIRKATTERCEHGKPLRKVKNGAANSSRS